MTLGVIDEFRKKGVAKGLLDYTYKFINFLEPQCNLIYLHVITHNEGGINFYDKMRFINLFTSKDHYTIDGKEYDAYLLFRSIGEGITKKSINDQESNLEEAKN